MITYTCFKKVSTIQDTIGQDTTLTLAFTYGINNQRVKTVLSRNSSVERIKYFDGDYEEDSTSAGLKKYHYIHAPTGLVGIFVSEGTADTLYHVLSDNPGSINAVINSETNEIRKYSYSAWGIPRDPDDWTSELSGDLFAGRGFTAHVCEDWNWQDEVDDNSTSELIPMSAANIGKHLLEFNLINMNGRVYDPVLARFLSPDPFVQFPGVADGHNRYAYVMNNPLRFTDPSGYYSLEHIIDLLMNSEYGGTWTSQGGLSYFATQGQVSMFVAHDLPALATSGGGGGGTSYVVTPTSIPGSFQYVGFLDYSQKDFFIGKSITGEPIYINLGPSVGVIGMYLLNSTYSANALVQNLSGSWGNTHNGIFIGNQGPGDSSGGAANRGDGVSYNQRVSEISLGIDISAGLVETAGKTTALQLGNGVKGVSAVSKIGRGAGTIGFVIAGVHAGYEYKTGNANTHTVIDLGVTALAATAVGVGVIVSSPIIITGAAIGGAAWGIYSLFGGGEAIDNKTNNWGRDQIFYRNR